MLQIAHVICPSCARIQTAAGAAGTAPSSTASIVRNKGVKAPNQNEEETPLTETIRDFLDPAEFYNLLKSRGMDFYCGVPDSLLKDFCGYVSDTAPAENHVITANEVRVWIYAAVAE